MRDVIEIRRLSIDKQFIVDVKAATSDSGSFNRLSLSTISKKTWWALKMQNWSEIQQDSPEAKETKSLENQPIKKRGYSVFYLGVLSNY